MRLSGLSNLMKIKLTHNFGRCVMIRSKISSIMTLIKIGKLNSTIRRAFVDRRFLGLSIRLLVTLILIKMALCTRFGELRVTLPLGVNKISQRKELGSLTDMYSKSKRRRSLKSRSKVNCFIKELKILWQMEMQLSLWLLKETQVKL